MININTNLSSLIAQNSLKTSTNKLNETIERMSSGYKINHAKDNAANYSISTNMTTKIGAYSVAQDNAAMGLDMVTTASETINEMQNHAERLRALATQARNGTYGAQSLEAMQQEADSITAEINRLYSTAEYNKVKLFEPNSVEPRKDFTNLERVSEAAILEANKSYRIDDYDDLVALQDYVNNGGDTTNVTFELTADIDMKDKEFERIGSPSNPFKGNFNGNNYVIKNLTINLDKSQVGFWGRTENATIQNLGIVNCNIKGVSSVGALVGYATNTTITNCYSTGLVEGTGDYIGGLIGLCKNNTKINKCYTNTSAKSYHSCAGGLVGSFEDSELSNSYAIGSVYSEMYDAGGLIGFTGNSKIINCYSASDVTGKIFRIGGLIGYDLSSTIENSYSTGSVSGDTRVGGLVGQTYQNSVVNNCFTLSKVDGNSQTGAFIGFDNGNTTSGVGNYCSNQQTGLKAVGTGIFNNVESKSNDEIKEICSYETMGFTESNGWKLVDGSPCLSWEARANIPTVSLQVGINAQNSSNIQFKVGFTISEIDSILNYGISDDKTLGIIDELINKLSAKSTEYGAVQNRLESVLDEIATQYDNLVSSRSTLRDADMAELSSTYIQQQILQEASATLMATANQMPAIALQLL